MECTFQASTVPRTGPVAMTTLVPVILFLLNCSKTPPPGTLDRPVAVTRRRPACQVLSSGVTALKRRASHAPDVLLCVYINRDEVDGALLSIYGINKSVYTVQPNQMELGKTGYDLL